jgi:HPt (histidine-containing phosphotransfer) domain-containing protein
MPFDPQDAADAFELEIEDIVDIVEDYFESVKDDIHSLEHAIRDKNYDQMSADAHKIKGSAANLRINVLSSAAKEIEMAAKEREGLDYQSKVTVLKELVDIAQSQFKDRC